MTDLFVVSQPLALAIFLYLGIPDLHRQSETRVVRAREEKWNLKRVVTFAKSGRLCCWCWSCLSARQSEGAVAEYKHLPKVGTYIPKL